LLELSRSKPRIRSSGPGSIPFRLLIANYPSLQITNNLSFISLLLARILRSLKATSQVHLLMDHAHHYQRIKSRRKRSQNQRYSDPPQERQAIRSQLRVVLNHRLRSNISRKMSIRRMKPSPSNTRRRNTKRMN
jgi:hypothetical protein